MAGLMASPRNAIHPEAKLDARHKREAQRGNENTPTQLKVGREKTDRRALEIPYTAEAEAVRTDHGSFNHPQATLQGPNAFPGTRLPLPLFVLP